MDVAIAGTGISRESFPSLPEAAIKGVAKSARREKRRAGIMLLNRIPCENTIPAPSMFEKISPRGSHVFP